jgi:NAD(P)-dependent dehydrogenase (short-subunit alcohol dehydrogenase family)
MIAVQGDLTILEDRDRIVTEIESRHGFINLLVSNAGVLRSALPRTLELGPSEEEATPSSGPHPGIRRLQGQLAAGGPADFAGIIDLNVTHSYYLALAFLPLLEAGNRSDYARTRDVTSQIISISSVHGRRKDRGIASIPYTLSKGAIEHYAQILASILGKWKIRSNAILPGLYPSGELRVPPLKAHMISDTNSPPNAEMTDPFFDNLPWKDQIPAGRLGGSQDFAGLTLFLASRAGAYVNGASHVIDGAWLEESIGAYPLLRGPDPK